MDTFHRLSTSNMSQLTGSVSCLCGKVAQDVGLDPSGKLSALQLCHCNSCRFASGLLCISYLSLRSKPHIDSNLKEYRQSDKISRWFCTTCGAHAFAHNKQDHRYLVAAGLLTTTGTAETKSVTHYGVKDSRRWIEYYPTRANHRGQFMLARGWHNRKSSCHRATSTWFIE